MLRGARGPWRAAGLAAALLAAHAALGLWSIRSQGVTFDEPALSVAGLSYWKTGDLRLESQDPPLGLAWLGLANAAARLSLPLDGEEWKGAYVHAFADRVLFWSGNDADAFLRRARALNLALSLLVAACLWAWTRRFGEGAALCALALYALSPTVLAHASLATLDLPSTAAVTLAMLALASWLERPAAKAAAAFAAALAAAALCKYSALAAAAGAGAAILLGRERRKLRAPALIFALGCLVAAGGALLLWPHLRLGLEERLREALMGRHPTFLLGRLSDRGWAWYYAVAVGVKSTLPELLALFAGLGFFSTRRGSPAARAAGLAGLCVGGAYLLAASISHKQIGIRYVLPVYPAIALAAAPAAAALLKKPKGAVLAACLIAWQASASLATGPDWLSYFNEAVGGPDAGPRYLADSNLDWGQDLGRLASWVHAQGDPPLVLAYFGLDSTEHYKLRAQLLRSNNQIQRRRAAPVDAPRELLAISVTHLQEVYWPPPGVPAALKRATPLARVGRTIRVYDISRDAGIHRWLQAVYAADGDQALASREGARALWIAEHAGP